MKKGIIFIIICIFSITYSCRNDEESNAKEELTQINKTLIIGDWYPLDDIKDCDSDSDNKIYNRVKINLTGYQFLENDLCVNKLGFFEYIDSSRSSYYVSDYIIEEGKSFPESIKRYRGNLSVYSVESDILKIYNPSIRTWDEWKLYFPAIDTMILYSVNNSIMEKYVRKEYKIDTIPLFDQIILNYPATLYSRSKIFSIHRNGHFLSSGYFGKPLFSGRVEKDAFLYIETLFKKSRKMAALTEQVNTAHEGDFCFDDTLAITVISDGKMYTIKNLFDGINKEFYWAYFSLLYTPEMLHIYPEKSYGNHLYPYRGSNVVYELDDYVNFELIGEKKQKIELHLSERFYLATLLYNSDETKQSFHSKYKILGSRYNEPLLETDGRFFRYTHSYRGTIITYDIGFNFIEKNGF